MPFNKVHKRPEFGLYSPLFMWVKQCIRHLILDEGHKVKNRQALTNKAIGALLYEHILIISDKFLGNHWSDIHGLLSLIPGHPFRERQDFDRIFGGGNRNHPPLRTQRDRLKNSCKRL